MHDTEGLACETAGSRSRWQFAFRGVQLVLGLLGWGLTIVLFIRSHLGLGPWDAFHYGLHVQTGISIGAASILAGFAILLVTLAMKVRPGAATLLNMVLIGVFIDLLLPVVPDPTSLPVAVAYFALAIPMAGISSGMYIGAGFGHGPRDALMVALTLRTGWSVRRIRTLIELTVLGAGWLMGGTVGIGTLIIAITIGPAVQWGLKLFGAVPAVAPVAQRDAAAAPRRARWRFRRAA